MYDLVIRSLAALELIIMINADQVTTSTVAASLCVLSLLEASALADARNEERSQILAWILFASSYIGVAGYLLLTNGDRSPYFPLLLTVLSFISSLLLLHLNHANEKMRQELHRTRDDSEELTEVLREQNRRLLNEQDQEVHLATLAERNRIAREIHDNVGHMLSRCILQMGALMAVHKNDEALYEQLSSVNTSLNEAMNNIRESVHDLHDESVDLKQSILEATSEIKKNYNLKLDYDIGNQVPRNVKYCMIAIVKEAMANIVKHSNATQVSVMMREHPAFYQLAIEDNGDVSNKNSNPGIGLNNMKERVEALDGTINFNTEQGFKIMVFLKK